MAEKETEKAGRQKQADAPEKQPGQDAEPGSKEHLGSDRPYEGEPDTFSKQVSES